MYLDGTQSTWVPEDPIYRLALATAAKVGSDFLSSLVRNLHSVMPVSLAFVAKAQGNPAERASAVFSWLDGVQGVPIDYALEGTPCKMIYENGSFVVPRALADRFPDKARFQSYCGVALEGTDGEPYGHFAVFSEATLEDPQKVEGIVRIFGMRAAAELQRIEEEAERERTIRKLDQQLDALHKANKFKSGALGMVAHDLRNPLAAIMGRAELIQTRLEKVKERGAAEGIEMETAHLEKSAASILKAADRMVAMISGLLESARAEHDRVEIKAAPVLLSAPVEAAICVVQREAKAKDIQIDYTCAEEITLSADEFRLTEVMVNLLSNAVKYSHGGSVVSVRIAAVDKGACARITVQDQGLGMSADDIKLAFRPYQTLSAKPTGGEGSTGLGLVIVKSVIEAHGGTVGVASEGPGQGSCFEIKLPI